jgi:hypothetical protein
MDLGGNGWFGRIRKYSFLGKSKTLFRFFLSTTLLISVLQRQVDCSKVVISP